VVWTAASVAFFVYLAIAAELVRGLQPPARWRVWAASALGAGVAMAARRLPADGVANVLLLPSAVLLIAYWASGRLFVRAMPRAERALRDIDLALRIQSIASRCPRVVAECLEFAYSGIYALIVVALLLALRYGVSADRFWTTILVTDFICFGALPWFQTRPPRALGFDAPWQSRWRPVNLLILGAGGVHVNTFPSGHAAEALVAALLASGAPALVVAGLFVFALSVSAGAVLGRYHYAADALAGWAVALIVYCSFRL
jgi:hypothetical protein